MKCPNTSYATEESNAASRFSGASHMRVVRVTVSHMRVITNDSYLFHE